MEKMNGVKKVLIIEEIKKELKEKQLLLCDLEINSFEYNKLFDEINILKKQLDILYSLNHTNFNIINSKLEKSERKYNFLVDLSYDQQRQFIMLVKKFQDNQYFEYSSNIIFSDILQDLKLKIISKGVNVTNVKNESEIEKILECINDEYLEFEKNINKFIEKITLLDLNCYNSLKYSVKHNVFLDIKTLKYFSKFSQDNLIKQILSYYDEIAKLEKRIVITSGVDKKVELLEKRILSKQALLLQNIDSYIVFNCSNVKEIDLNIDVSDKLNAIQLCDVVYELINEKKSQYKKLLNSVKNSLMLVEKMEKTIETGANKISSGLYNYIKRNNIDLSQFNNDKLNDLIAEVHLYRKMNKSDQLLIDTENKKLNKGGIGKND